MTDQQLIERYLARDEAAIAGTEQKYRRYCWSIAYGILENEEDAAECVNDTWLAAWNTIPPHRPENLSTYLGKLTRNTALKLWRARTAVKRGGGQMALALEDLAECVPASAGTEDSVLTGELADALNRFLDGLPKTSRQVFLRRYWLLQPVNMIALEHGFSVPKTASMLRRIRLKLRDYLSKEGLL